MGDKPLQFITSIPWDVRGGSGCYVGTSTLAESLRRFGIDVRLIKPNITTPFFITTRLLFNESLRWRHFDGAATIGVDADGYAIAGRGKERPHIACIKGVLRDAVRFESGATRASLALQADLERRNARRADLVITVSRYCAEKIEEFYGVRNVVVVPELIDLKDWRHQFRANPAAPDSHKFTVLSVCRFYPRKRVEVLLRAAVLLRKSIPELEIRIVGNGPQRDRLRADCNEFDLGRVVRWLGDASRSRLAEEYNRCDLFCLPSVQEGFGIVFLEAMAAGKAIVAVRASAIPEVVRHGILVEPDQPAALADAIQHLYLHPENRLDLGMAGFREVGQFDTDRVAARFILEIGKVVPTLHTGGREHIDDRRQTIVGT
jgi:glycosyltransferase involved in cell wall biosynthesis